MLFTESKNIVPRVLAEVIKFLNLENTGNYTSHYACELKTQFPKNGHFKISKSIFSYTAIILKISGYVLETIHKRLADLDFWVRPLENVNSIFYMLDLKKFQIPDWKFSKS